jgi:putative phosphoesterase
MMGLARRIAFVSDIHGNLEALQAVSSLIKGVPTYCCGDIVGYGANPEEAVAWVRDNCSGSVMGNHDHAVVSGETGWFNPAAAKAILWTRKTISRESMEFLSKLPSSFRFEADGVRFLVVHGSPEDPLHEYVYLETHQDLFGYYLSHHSADVLALGHTHHPFVARTSEGTVFNPGSVGQPRHGVPGAFYAIVTIADGRVEVDEMKVEYEVSTAANKIYDAGLPRILGERLYEGF